MKREVQDAYLEPFFVYAVQLQGQARRQPASDVDFFGRNVKGGGSGRQHYHQFKNSVCI